MKKTIICFGDSNTHGYDAVTGGRFPYEKRWTGVLQKELGESFQVIEEGLGGRTTVFEDPLSEGLSGLPYLAPCLKSHEPFDLVILMLGTNDTKSRFSASSANIGNGMRRLAQKAQEVIRQLGRPGQVMIAAPLPIDPRYENTSVIDDMGPGCAEKSQKLAYYYQQAAQDLGCLFLDAGSIPGLQMNEKDYMHLSKKSHEIFGKALAEKILVSLEPPL